MYCSSIICIQNCSAIENTLMNKRDKNPCPIELCSTGGEDNKGQGSMQD